MSSTGQYGTTPFLYPLYGTSELSQAFCRVCAVHGGVYVLGRGLREIAVRESDGRCVGVVCTEGQTLRSNWLVLSADYLHSRETKYDACDSFARFSVDVCAGSAVARFVGIVTAPVLAGTAKAALAIIPPNTLPGVTASIRIVFSRA
jgi:hypothetical protein